MFLDFFDTIIRGIFTQPTTSVVAILIAFLVLGTWLYHTQIKNTLALQKSLLDEIKKNNQRFDKLLEHHTAHELKIRDLHVKLVEMYGLLQKNFKS
jgi:hypothetical protein